MFRAGYNTSRVAAGLVANIMPARAPSTVIERKLGFFLWVRIILHKRVVTVLGRVQAHVLERYFWMGLTDSFLRGSLLVGEPQTGLC